MTRRFWRRSGPTRRGGRRWGRSRSFFTWRTRSNQPATTRAWDACALWPGKIYTRAAEESLRRAIAHNEERGKATHPASLAMLEWLEADRTAQSRIE